MKYLITLLTISSLVFCANSQAAPASAPVAASGAVTVPSAQPVAPSTTTTVNGGIQTRNGLTPNQNTTAAGQTTTSSGTTTTPGAMNPSLNNPAFVAGTNGLGFNNGLGFSNGVNNFNGTNGVNTTADLGNVAGLLVNLQSSIEQTLPALISLNPRVNGQPDAGRDNIGMNGQAGNNRALTASGDVNGIPPASAAGQLLPPTGNSTGMAGSATTGSQASIGTDPRTFQMLRILEHNLSQADAILKNLNGTGANANINGNINGTANNPNGSANGNFVFPNRFTVFTNNLPVRPQ